MQTLKIKFTNETNCKYFQYENLEFFAYKQGREGYTLKVCEYYHVSDAYQLNKFCSRNYKTNFNWEPVNIDTIREQILQTIANYKN